MEPVCVREVALPTDVDVTVYDVIALPPLFAGGAKDTVIVPSPPAALLIVGAPGSDPAGRTDRNVPRLLSWDRSDGFAKN